MEQIDLFEPGFTISGLAAGPVTDLYLTSGTNIFRYSTGGTQLGSITFSNIDYQGIAAGSGELSHAFLMTNAASSNVSSLNLINTSSQTQEFFGTLYNGSGTKLGLANTSLGSAIAPNGRVIVTAAQMEDLFSTPTWSGPAVLDVTGSADFNAIIKLKSPSGLVSNTNCVRQSRVDNIEGSSANGRTFIRFINTGSTKISNIIGTLAITKNDAVRESQQVLISSLGPKQSVWKNGDETSQLFSEIWPGAASVTVTSNGSNLELLNLNFVNEETFFNFSCYENSAE